MSHRFDAMQQALEPIKGLVKVERYEMINPQVYRAGDAVILTYHLVSCGRSLAGDATAVRWNSTAVLCANRPAMGHRPQPLGVHEVGAQRSRWAIKNSPHRSE